MLNDNEKKYSCCDEVLNEAEKMLVYLNETIKFHSEDENIRQEFTSERCDKYVTHLLKVRDAVNQVISTAEYTITFTTD
jgi:hypothetical protein